ncbi:MAG TPA: DUF58 domain-containing protein [Candidatus Eisenbacteria bacterium]|nr:DUF58 domain-containing protein [Candidatus Eisenbacteria bacterium]
MPAFLSSSPSLSRRYLDPGVVSRLGSLDLRARLVVEGFISGLHKSPFHGFSVEFVEHRPYMPGDPLRNVDWKVYAKSDRFYVKQYEDETNLRAYLLLDHSASMGFRSKEASVSKFEYARTLAAALAYLLLGQQDAVGLLTFADTVGAFVPPRGTRSHLEALLREIDRVRPTGKTALGATLHALAERARRRGLVVLFSDLMADPSEVLSGIRHFRHRRHEVILFHLLDPAEWSFDFKDASTFVDVETGEEVSLEPWQFHTTYRKAVRSWSERYQRECGEQHVDYVRLTTDLPYDVALLRYLEKRRRLF